MKIKVENLCKSFNHLVLFNHLNLEIPENQITCIYGTSGCGKTTLLDIIGLIEPYQSGNIYYDGRTIKNEKEKRKMLREKIGFVFQDFGLIENETVLNNLKIVKKIANLKDNEKEINPVLESLQLPIAKIILKCPDLILADEPTASLDKNNKQIILELLKNFSKEGKTVIIVTHDKETIDIADYKVDLTQLKAGESCHV